MPSQLGKYTLIRTLGSGANSKVKLGVEQSTGDYFAVKILKKGNPNLDSKFLELVLTEVETMAQLSHPNIVNLIEYGKEGVVKKSNGREEHVIYIVLELATGGELFDFVATTGKFSYPIARFYFMQLIEGLSYVHSKGVTHRDLKPENVLYDQFFNLKIADFGFAAPIEGRDESGYLKTKLGTEGYMAPEIHQRKPYKGESVDLFASGIILFIMVTQHPPFNRAEPSDPFYKLLCANRPDLFWKAHSRNKPAGFFTEEFMSLITGLLKYDPSQRIGMEELKTHNWFAGELPSIEDIQSEFVGRKAKIDADNEQKRLAKEQEKAQRQGGSAQRQVYRNNMQGDDEENEEMKQELDESVQRQLDQYVRIVHKNTEFFSTSSPTLLLSVLNQFANEKGFQIEVSKDKYKAKLTLQSEDENIEIKSCILAVVGSEEGKVCVEFQKSGQTDALKFFEKFGEIKEYFGEFINSSY